MEARDAGKAGPPVKVHLPVPEDVHAVVNGMNACVTGIRATRCRFSRLRL